MKAILLCAGRGSRLDPLTMDRPKCLVEVDGMAILDHQIAALRACGIRPAVVVAGYRCDRVMDHVAGHRFERGIEIAYNPRWATSNSIASVWTARAHLRNPFLLVNGDTIFAPELLACALRRVEEGVNLVIERSAAHFDDMRVAMAGGRISAVGKGLDGAAFRSLGMIVSTGGVRYLDALSDTLGRPDGDQKFHHAVIDRLASDAAVAAVTVAGMRWQEIDRVADIDRWHARTGQYAA